MEGPFSLLDGHEQVVYGGDEGAGLRCIIAIHSTALGPGLGGTRFFPYASEEEALVDVLRLSRAMAYKAACAGLDLGGGKAVIIGDPARDKTEALLRAYGRVVASLNGRYVTACDVGTYPADMSIVARETRWATGAEVEEGGSGDSGVLTAYGTFVGIRACVERAFGSSSLADRHVAIQGVGKVGYRLAGYLAGEGAKLTVADVDGAAAARCAERYGAQLVPVDRVHAVDADVFSPNALGGVISDATLPELACAIVAGAANNQLAEPRHGEALADAGILYAPDYVINAGGLIQVADELHPGGYSAERAERRVATIADRLHAVFALAAEEGCSTAEAAERFAERRMASIGRLKRFWLPR
ncbi:MAG TPA: Glu/Leu/Phe/Val dehydrogenase dimerization domain-containing protein [Egibacteraceae bacterium]|nr:Glu/Leu/Phe/Val dehydrogenase dimerization domain-containing protein [Egibacteraceae bacterium]